MTMKRVGWWSTWIVALLFFLFSISFTLLRYYTSDISQYRGAILEKLEAITKTPVSIESMRGVWQGFSPTILIKNAVLTLDIDPEIAIRAQSMKIQLNVFASLWKQTPVFRYVFVNQAAIDIRLHEPKRDPREVLHSVLEFLPQLTSGALENIHLKIYFKDSAEANIEFKDLNAYFFGKNLKGFYQFEFIEKQNNRQNRMVWRWKSAFDATLFLALDHYTLPIKTAFNPKLSGNLWGHWRNKDLASLYGSLMLDAEMLTKSLPLSLSLDNKSGYQIALKSEAGAVGARFFNQRFGIQITDFNWSHLRDYYKTAPKIIDQLFVKKAWSSGVFKTGIDSIDLDVTELGLKLSEDDFLPHIDTIGFTAKGDLSKGALKFTKGLRLNRGFFKEDITNIALTNNVFYHFGKGRLTFFPNLTINHDAVSANMEGQFSIAFKKGYKPAVFSNLFGEIEPLPVKEVLRYLPKSHIPKSVNDWLDTALAAGGNTKGNAHYKLWGDYRKSPWKVDSNPTISQFRVEFDVDNVSLNMLPNQLVPLNNIEARVVIENNALNVHGTATILDKILLSNINVDIPHFHRAHLAIKGDIAGDFSIVKQYFNKSTLLHSVDEVLKEFSGESALQGNLALTIPLARKNTPPLSVSGFVDLKEAKITFTPAQFNLAKGNGRIYFDEKGLVKSEKLSGIVREHLVSFSISRNKTGTIISTTGQQALIPWLEQYAPLLKPFINTTGLARVQSTTTIPFTDPHFWAIDINADLKNVQMDIDFGLDKSKNMTGVLKVNVAAKENQKKEINIALAELLKVSMQTSPANLWEDLRININTVEAKGEINSSSPKKFEIVFDHLVLPYQSRLDMDTIKSIHQTSPMFDKASYAYMPEVNLVVRSLYRGNEPLGRLTAKSKFDKDSWDINPIKLISDQHDVDAVLEWRPDDPNYKTVLSAQFNTSEKEAMNNILGMDIGLTGLMRGEVNVTSKKSINQLTFDTIDVVGKIYVKNGNIRSVSIGPLKALGAMNLSTLSRRMMFDFSDLKDRGLSFDAAEGMIDLKQNILFLKDVIVDAPSLNAKLNGTVDLTRKQYDINIKAFPKASIIAPIAGTLLGGPIVGAGVLVFERIFNDKINQVSRTDFQWSGEY